MPASTMQLLAFTSLLSAAALAFPSQRAAQPTALISMVNEYPGDLLPLSYSCVHSTSLPQGSDGSLKLTLRIKEHLLHGWIRNTGDTALHAYTDKGNYLSFYPSTGLYGLFPASASLSSDTRFVFLDADIADYLYTVNVDNTVRASHPGNGSQAVANVGTFALPVPSAGVYDELSLPTLDAAGGRLFVQSRSYGEQSAIYEFDVASNTTRVAYRSSAADEAFCGMKYGGDGSLLVLLEQHNTTAFPDRDCQNLSGTVTRFAVRKVDLSTGQVSDIVELGTYMGERSGGPLDASNDAWYVLNAGTVMVVDVANKRLLNTTSADVEGGSAILVY